MAYDLLRPEEVAKQLGMSLSWVYGNKHTIGFVRFGKAVRFEQEALEEYARKCRRGPQLEEDLQWDTQSQKEKTAAAGSSERRSTVAVLSELFKQKEKLGNTQ